jgi:hypothetical protein
LQGWLERFHEKNDGKIKIMKEIIIIQMVDAVAVARATMAAEDADDAEGAEEATEVASEAAATIVSI